MYNLLKMAKSLSREEKEFFLENIEELFVLATRKEVKRNKEIMNFEFQDYPYLKDEEEADTKKDPDKDYIPRNYTHLNNDNDADTANTIVGSKNNFIKLSKKLDDPETPEEILELVKIIEKNIRNNEDISFGNFSIFLIPLLRGSQRIGLKSYYIISLCKKCVRISKKYQKFKNKKMFKEQNDCKRDFKICINEIKTKIQEKVETKSLEKKAGLGYAFEENIKNLINSGMPREDIFEKLYSIKNNIDMSNEEFENLLSQI